MRFRLERDVKNDVGSVPNVVVTLPIPIPPRLTAEIGTASVSMAPVIKMLPVLDTASANVG